MRKKDFEGLTEGLKEAIAHARGEDAPGLRVHIPTDIDIKAIRERLGVTQAVFAERYGFSRGAVRDWEQGRKVPDQSTRAYLKVIAAEPKVVDRVLETA
ncbi:MAG TPA: helix-turn-helix domain-containing protein [Caulobacteraceae bacterium]|jgi:putative transcriptional regulator